MASKQGQQEITGYLPDDTPSILRLIFFALQQIIVMLPATVLVALITGFHVSTTIFASGLATLCFILITRRRIPLYYGSSFSYLAAVLAITGVKNMGDIAPDYLISQAQCGIIASGLVSIIAGLIINRFGQEQVRRVLPPAVTGSVAVVIGISLAGGAMTGAAANWGAAFGHSHGHNPLLRLPAGHLGPTPGTVRGHGRVFDGPAPGEDRLQRRGQCGHCIGAPFYLPYLEPGGNFRHHAHCHRHNPRIHRASLPNRSLRQQPGTEARPQEGVPDCRPSRHEPDRRRHRRHGGRRDGRTGGHQLRGEQQRHGDHPELLGPGADSGGLLSPWFWPSRANWPPWSTRCPARSSAASRSISSGLSAPRALP